MGDVWSLFQMYLHGGAIFVSLFAVIALYIIHRDARAMYDRVKSIDVQVSELRVDVAALQAQIEIVLHVVNGGSHRDRDREHHR